MTTFVRQHLTENVRMVFCNNLGFVSLVTNVPIEFVDLIFLFHAQLFKKNLITYYYAQNFQTMANEQVTCELRLMVFITHFSLDQIFVGESYLA